MTKKKIKIAPSILSADFSKLADEVKRIEDSGADFLHIDVMDGHFVPNITIGPAVIKAIRSKTKLTLDTHLMIEHPDRFIRNFADAGSDIITIHVETYNKSKLESIIEQIKSLRIKAGIVLNPETPLSNTDGLLDKVDMVLIMSVNPGFAGQKFIPSVLQKINNLSNKFEGDIEVDGGINMETARAAVEEGANILVAGSYLFGEKNMKEAVRKLKALSL